jgi:uncharacterized protein
MTASDETPSAPTESTPPVPETQPPTESEAPPPPAPEATAEPQSLPPEAASPDIGVPAEGGAPEAAAPPPPPREPALPSQPVPQVPPAPQPHDLSRIAQDLQIRKGQVEAVVQLLDDGNTVPFITRYRKERTGNLNEEAIRRIQERVGNLRALADRKHTIFKSIAFQGRLTDDLTQAILAAESPKRLEDLYQPFKPKKRSLATEAREKGLEPFAMAIWTRDTAVTDITEMAKGLVDPDKWLLNEDEVVAGAKHILADVIADSPHVRGPIRAFIWDTGMIAARKLEALPEGKGKEYEPYFSFKEPARDIPPHRVLAINRGEKANVLKGRIDADMDKAQEIAVYHLELANHPHREFLLPIVKDALERIVMPSLEREIRRELTERAQDHAVLVFAKNLRSLLLQPPLRGKKVLAVDPGIRTGCKLAVLDETGKLLEDAVIYPHGQKKNASDAKRKLEQLVRKNQIAVIAIGNGTGCRETEQLVADLISDLEQRRLNPTPVVTAPPPEKEKKTPPPVTPVVSEVAPPDAVTTPSEAVPTENAVFTSGPFILSSEAMTITSEVTAAPEVTAETTGAVAPIGDTVSSNTPTPPPPPKQPEIVLDGLPEAPADLAYVIVIEAGASDYSASPVAREEFPQLDATTRGTVSIGRRLQDPLAELVKIDPQHIGVGLYQHDVKAKHLKESLEAVIESCVNTVGVDLNTASVPLLRHVSGMNQMVAREVVTHRERNGPFTSREQLMGITGMGEKRYTQAAGFLKIPDAADPLDKTWIHPESYPLAREILEKLGFTPADLGDKAKLDDLREKTKDLNPEEVAEFHKAGVPTVADILEALAKPGRDPREDVPPPIFKKGVLRLEDISPQMELKGTVLNVVPFGAFVDIGLKESGLVHISQMANRYIKSPYDVVAVGDVVTVWVIEVKPGEKKISLSMIAPGQERRPPEPRRFDGPPREQREPRPPRQDAPPRQPQPQGDRQGADRGPPPRRFDGPRPGGGRGPQPRGGFVPRPGGPPPRPQPQPQGETAPPPPVAPPRPPAKPKPLPKLTADKKSGKAPLNTFAELMAMFSPEPPPPPPEPPKAPPKPKAEEPPPEPKAEEKPPEQPAPPAESPPPEAPPAT